MVIRIGIDTGGTFTDFVMVGPDGLRLHKIRSTPEDPSRAILQGLQELLGQAASHEPPTTNRARSHSPATTPKPVLDIVHGSTVATNALLERKGARVAFLTTEGFEDILRIGRQTRRELYNFMVEDRRPLVQPELTFGIPERMAANGEEVAPLDLDAVAPVVDRIGRAGVESVAVCLLHAYINPAHEQALCRVLEDRGLFVSASHRILPEYREFERASTTVVNAYVTPKMAAYLDALERRLAGMAPTPPPGRTVRSGLPATLRVMQSNGGAVSAAAARAAAVQTVLSGPAAGVVGAFATGRAAGSARLISFDMGGTSTDVSLVDGRIGVTSESTVGEFPVRLPMLDIHTVGAGGGSLAWVDRGGSLRVGPQSAGADPGPACYGTGAEPTVTDANLLLGRLEPAMFFGGRMRLDESRARRAVAALAGRLGLDVLTLAEGIVRVANANMERAIRVVSVERGYDPRDFALLAFGGAGAMHACDLARTLGIRRVIAPRLAGVLSALGMLLADVTRDYSQSILQAVECTTTAEIDRRFHRLVERARQDLAGEGFPARAIVIDRLLDLRYVGQSYEITVPLTRGFRRVFDAEHERRYGYADPARPAEIVNLRVKAIGVTAKPALPCSRPRPVRPAPIARRPAWFGGRRHMTAVYRWEALEPGATGRGPSIIAGAEATAVVPPGFRFHIDRFGNVIATW